MKKSRTTEDWQALIERYYYGLTSDEEERELQEYLFSSAQQANPATKADRAVMAYMATGKLLNKKQRHSNVGMYRIMAAASLVGIVALAAVGLFRWEQTSSNWTSIDGTMYYSENIARDQMEQNLSALLSGYTTVEDELSLIFTE